MGSLYQRQQALQSTESSATLVHAIIREKYGEEAYGWDPLTVALEIQDDFMIEASSEVMDRWSAIQVIMTSDACFKRLDAFMAICNTLNDGQPFFSVFDPVTTEEAAWGLTEIALNREMLPLGYPVKRYLKQVLRSDGYDNESTWPDIFKEAFELNPSSQDVRALLAEPTAAERNKTNIEIYVGEQLQELVMQFNKISDLKQLDNLILDRGFDEAVYLIDPSRGGG